MYCDSAAADTAGKSGLCQDLDLWGFDNPDESALYEECGILGSDTNGDERFISVACIGKRTFLCNALPTVDYICYEDSNSSWIGVLKYDYFYRYSNINDTLRLQWNESNLRWNFNGNGYCESEQLFLLPYDDDCDLLDIDDRFVACSC